MNGIVIARYDLPIFGRVCVVKNNVNKKYGIAVPNFESNVYGVSDSIEETFREAHTEIMNILGEKVSGLQKELEGINVVDVNIFTFLSERNAQELKNSLEKI